MPTTDSQPDTLPESKRRHTAPEETLTAIVCCARNQNRSMAVHEAALLHNWPIRSFGTAPEVSLPGETPDTPITFPYSTSYAAAAELLRTRNEAFFKKRGILKMLDRNRRIKPAPEYLFDSVTKKAGNATLIVALDEQSFKDIFRRFCKHRPLNWPESADAAEETAGEEEKAFLVGVAVPDTLEDAEAAAESVYEFLADVQRLIGGGTALKNAVDESLEKSLGKCKYAMLAVPIVASLEN